MSDTKMTCAICQDNFSDSAVDVCGSGHHWCQDCLRGSVVAAHRNATDPTVMPPRCCGVPVFPIDTIFEAQEHPVLRFLDAESLELWRVATLRAREAVSGYVHVDGDIVRMARRARHPNFCICRHEFCMICGETWPPDMQQPTEDEQPPGLCHKFFGDDDKHILHIPAEVQARLDAEAEIPPPAEEELVEG
ncbi:hypothetical protein N0V88_004753 [Collariella sp. IMI 366227]|nr:hypothetical protein N0V88_004753 [Collariella sp. IMI 366227]